MLFYVEIVSKERGALIDLIDVYLNTESIRYAWIHGTLNPDEQLQQVTCSRSIAPATQIESKLKHITKRKKGSEVLTSFKFFKKT